jgi:hypothetical protein
VRWRFAAFTVAAALLAGAAFSPAAGAAAAGPGSGTVNRVLIFSLPGATWAQIGEAETPNLHRLLAGSAVASCSVRAVHRTTSPGEGYVTVGAGTAAGGVDGLDNLAFQAGEPLEDGTAAEAFTRRTGQVPSGEVVSMATQALVDDAAGRHRGAEVGALARSLARAGVPRAVVANADLSLHHSGLSTFHREAALALADPHGVVEAGDVQRHLLRPDPSAPFGVRLDPEATVAAFHRAWAASARSVVLVEASDLARAHAYRALTAQAQFEVLLRRELRTTDALLGRILASVDAAHDAVLVVAPSNPGDGVHLSVAALRAPGVTPGLLVSGSTRRPGFVTLTDYAPTVLSLLGLPRPGSMEGRPFEVRPAAGRGSFPPVGGLMKADANARFRDTMLAPVAAAYVAAQILLSLIAVIALARPSPRAGVRAGVAGGALWLLAVVPLSFLPAVLGITSAVPYVAFVAGGAVVPAVLAARLAGRRRGSSAGALRPVAALLALLLGLHLADVVTGAHLQIATVFGYSPTVGGRFAGFGNVAFAQVAASAILLAGLIAHLARRHRGTLVATGLLGAALLADGMPIWGSDVGGVLAAVPAFAVVALGLHRARFSWRRAAGLGAAAVTAVGAFGALDLLRPAPERTHLGRLLERIGNEGFEPLAEVVQRKAAANLAVLPTSIWVPLVPAVLAFLGWLAWGTSDRLEAIRARVPELRPVLAGVLVAGALGLALNDSGIAVPATMLGVLNPVLVYLAVRLD